MWQRFTERSRKAIFYAQEEAGRLGENHVETEHLLLGLVREEDSVAARIIDRIGVSLESIRSEVERQVVHGNGRLGQDMQLTTRTKRVVDLAYDEARLLDHNYIGTEHLLLGLISEGEGMAGRILASLGIELERARREVRYLQGDAVVAEPGAPSVKRSNPPAPSAEMPATLKEQLALVRTKLKQQTRAVLEIDIAIGKLAEAEAAIVRGESPVALSQLGSGKEWVYLAAHLLGAVLVMEELDRETGA